MEIQVRLGSRDSPEVFNYVARNFDRISTISNVHVGASEESESCACFVGSSREFREEIAKSSVVILDGLDFSYSTVK